MSRPPPLSAARVRAELRDHPKWTLQEDSARAPYVTSIRRDYVFPTFRHAMQFMTDTAEAIDRIDHHPNWSNIYNKLNIELNTWDGAKGERNTVTDLDIEIAKILDERAPVFFESTPPDMGAAPRTQIQPTVHAGSTGVAITGTHGGPIRHIAWSMDGKHIASAAGGDVRLWTSDGDPTAQFRIQGEPGGKQLHVMRLAWSADGQALAGASSGEHVDVWNLLETALSSEQIGWPRGVRVLDLCWSPRQRALVGVGEENNVRVWFPGSEIGKWKLLVLRRPDHPAVSYRSVLWSPDDSILAGASDGRIDRWVTGPGGWSPEATQCYSPFEARYGHSHWVMGLAAARDGQQVVSVGSDRTLRVWNSQSGTIDADRDGRLRILRDLPEFPTSVGYAARDSLVAVGSPWGTVAVFDTTNWMASMPVRLEGNFTASETNVAVSPDKARAALVGPEGDRVWIIPLAQQPATLPARQSHRIFVSYAREDAPFLDRFLTAVKQLERDSRVTIFTDGKLEPGVDWAARLSGEMKEADVFVLLVSPDFTGSDFIYSVELTTALQRHESGTARVIPILIRPTPFIETSPLQKLQWLPAGRVPVTSPSWSHPDFAWQSVAEGLGATLETMASDKR